MLDRLDRLHETVSAVCPIVGVSVRVPETATIEFAPSATDSQRVAANAALAGFDWSQPAHEAWLLNKFRERAQTAIDNQNQEVNGLIRALALVVLNENNALRSWLRDFKTEVSAATNLADLKTRVAALPAMADRTAIQLRNAIKQQIADGNADS